MAFPTTHWTMLADATLDGDNAGREALSRFCRAYRPPLEASLRRYGIPEDQLEDHLQDFFLKLMSGRLWKRADAARGRFRTFLITILHNMLLHYWRADGRIKRGSGRAPHNLEELEDEGLELSQPPCQQVHDFDRDWALHLVDQSLAKLEAEWVGLGKGAEFSTLRLFLPGAEGQITQEEAAQRLGTSSGTVRVTVHRLRQRFRELLRAAVARTVSAPHEVDDELRYLGHVLMNQVE